MSVATSALRAGAARFSSRSLLKMSACGLLMGLLTLCAAAPASAATGDLWVYSTGHFRSIGNNKWVEYQHGRKVFDFVETARGPSAVFLYDASRKVIVALHAAECKITENGQARLGYKGHFYFTVFAYQGGEFRDVGHDKWQEFQNGGKAFEFRVTSRSSDHATLFDDSRGIEVVIRPTEFIVNSAGERLFSKAGHWAK